MQLLPGQSYAIVFVLLIFVPLVYIGHSNRRSTDLVELHFPFFESQSVQRIQSNVRSRTMVMETELQVRLEAYFPEQPQELSTSDCHRLYNLV